MSSAHRSVRPGRWIPGPALTALALALFAASAGAGETMLETFSGDAKFAPMWPGGTVEQGRDDGLPWLRVVTDGQAGGTFAANVRPYKPNFDFTNKLVKIWVKIDDLSKLGGMEFRLSSDRFSTSYYAFSFPLYDDEDFNVVRDGVWTTLTFSFGSARVEGKPNRAAINSIGWYVSDRGEEAPLTAYWGGLAAVDQAPEGVVSFTFDDGYDDHFLAAQMMEPYGFAGTAYIIPEAVGQVEYMSLHQVVDLQERYGWDVAAHHTRPFTDMRPDELESSILGVQRYLVENQFQKGVRHLAYPLGRQNTELVRPLVRKHFASARVAGSGPETLPPADPHLLRTYNVTHETDPEDVGRAARIARENGEWLILMFHWIVEEPSFSTQYSIADFEKLLKEVKASGVRVMPLVEVFESCGSVRDEVCRLGPAVAAPAGR
ncbi:MAG: polysaccharide deacetylase family protein [Myxococcota bacterium]